MAGRAACTSRAQEVARPQEPSPVSTPAATCATETAAPARLLVVDDDADLLRLL